MTRSLGSFLGSFSRFFLSPEGANAHIGKHISLFVCRLSWVRFVILVVRQNCFFLNDTALSSCAIVQGSGTSGRQFERYVEDWRRVDRDENQGNGPLMVPSSPTRQLGAISRLQASPKLTHGAGGF